MKSYALVAPFVVLFLAVGALTATPILIQRRAEREREPAVKALAMSVRSTGDLIEMRAHLHAFARAALVPDETALPEIRAQLDRSFAALSAEGSPDASLLTSALRRMQQTFDETGRPTGLEPLTQLLMETLTAETRRATAASAQLEQVRARSIETSRLLDGMWALFAVAGAVIAGILVRGHQRLARQMHRLEQERSGELEQFSARVAHDIVSPLSSVSIGLQILSRKVADDPQAGEAAGMMRRSLQRVTVIVDELFRFAQSGARPQPGETADLGGVLEALQEELVPAAAERGVALTFEPAPAISVACAEGAILVAVQNLVRNAIRYVADAPKKRVVARATVLRDRVRVSIEDSGPGVPEGMEAAIFDPYVRGSRVGQGLGLGLATVKRIIESRNGRVGVVSRPDRGATFWIELPRAA
jgi:signal transduction histidine kinase